MLFMKVVSLIQYSYEKNCFQKDQVDILAQKLA